MEEIGKRLTEFADIKRISKKDMSDKTGIPYNSLIRMMNGTRAISGTTLEKIYKAYENINLQWLITGSGKMELSENSVAENTVKKETSSFNEVDQFEQTLLKYLEHDSIREKIQKIIDEREN